MVEIAPVPPRSLAGIASLRDRDRLHDALQAEFGTPVPMTASFVWRGERLLACVAPGRFLAAGDAQAAIPARLAKTLDGLAAVTDQSDMWAAWLVSGEGVRECLARVVPVELAPATFQIGHLALTRAGHLDVRVLRHADDNYEIAVTRSVAADLLYALNAASHGLPRTDPASQKH